MAAAVVNTMTKSTQEGIFFCRMWVSIRTIYNPSMPFFFQNSPSLLFYGQIVEGEFLKMVLLWKLVLLLPDKVSNKIIV